MTELIKILGFNLKYPSLNPHLPLMLTVLLMDLFNLVPLLTTISYPQDIVVIPNLSLMETSGLVTLLALLSNQGLNPRLPWRGNGKVKEGFGRRKGMEMRIEVMGSDSDWGNLPRCLSALATTTTESSEFYKMSNACSFSSCWRLAAIPLVTTPAGGCTMRGLELKGGLVT